MLHFKDIKLGLIKIPMQDKFKLLTVVYDKMLALWLAVQIHLIVLTNVNVLHTFQKAKSYVFYGYFAFSCIQTVHIFIIV